MTAKIDNLGRIVIPKSLRKRFDWNINDFLELDIDTYSNSVTLSKHVTKEEIKKEINRLNSLLHDIIKNEESTQ
jgi:AbrB family looped-hinge helix DNA binding protein